MLGKALKFVRGIGNLREIPMMDFAERICTFGEFYQKFESTFSSNQQTLNCNISELFKPTEMLHPILETLKTGYLHRQWLKSTKLKSGITKRPAKNQEILRLTLYLGNPVNMIEFVSF